jgi:hypothetical protein
LMLSRLNAIKKIQFDYIQIQWSRSSENIQFEHNEIRYS